MSSNEIQALKERLEDVEARNRDLELALGQSNHHLMAVTFHLPPSLNKALGLLLALPCVSNEMIVQRLCIGSDPKNIIFRLRREMKAWCDSHKVPVIEIQMKRQLGYWIDVETKIRVKNYLAESSEAFESSNINIVTPQVGV
jgi:hypothetical protein